VLHRRSKRPPEAQLRSSVELTSDRQGGDLAGRGLDMFVQVIQGHTGNSGQVRAQLDKWVKEVAPGAEGWLGTTSGVTDGADPIWWTRDQAARVAVC